MKKIHPDDARGAVALFARRTPDVPLYIKTVVWKDPVRYALCWKDAAGMYQTIATYSRDRDCVRRLRELGYRQEGNAWRLVPLAQQAA